MVEIQNRKNDLGNELAFPLRMTEGVGTAPTVSRRCGNFGICRIQLRSELQRAGTVVLFGIPSLPLCAWLQLEPLTVAKLEKALFRFLVKRFGSLTLIVFLVLGFVLRIY